MRSRLTQRGVSGRLGRPLPHRTDGAHQVPPLRVVQDTEGRKATVAVGTCLGQQVVVAIRAPVRQAPLVDVHHGVGLRGGPGGQSP